MHAHDEHFLIVGTIEDANPPAFRQTAVRAPKKIMLQFFHARCLKLQTSQPFGSTPDMTCWMAPSLPAASIP